MINTFMMLLNKKDRTVDLLRRDGRPG